MTEKPWREREEPGVVSTDGLEPHGVSLEDEDFLDAIELAVLLTSELRIDWVAIFNFCGEAMRPVSRFEIAAALKLDPDEVGRCLDRLAEEKLLDEVAQSGTYTVRTGKRVSGEPDARARP